MDRILSGGDEVLRHAAVAGPPGLAPAARSRLEDPPETARTRLLVYWSGDVSSDEDYLSRAILRPYVETLRSIPAPPDRFHTQGRCPFCGGLPVGGSRAARDP